MLEHVGFGNIRVTGNYTDAAPTDDDEVFSVLASK